ncbi:MAG TPA: hypothetical protein PLF26_01995 [Blastocatellia bacterium]|nr:hypothetical protein [Blastocatellia bacterium]
MQQNKPTGKPHGPVFGVGDEVAYALGKGLRYGSVVRLIGAGDGAQVEIQFEDGGREVHKMRDRALSLLRRASGVSAHDEAREQRNKPRDYSIDEVRRSDQRRR